MSFTISGSSSPLVGSSPADGVIAPSSPSCTVVNSYRNRRQHLCGLADLERPLLESFPEVLRLRAHDCFMHEEGIWAARDRAVTKLARFEDPGAWISISECHLCDRPSLYHASPALWALYGLAMAHVSST